MTICEGRALKMLSEKSARVLMVPGIDNSGLGHWQTFWQAEDPTIVRAQLGMWDQPRRNAWVTNLGHAIRSMAGPVVLCAHSLGCLAVAWWALLEGQRHQLPVVGALLVAPPDCDREDVSPRLKDFGPTPSVTLPFPSLLVASRDDPYASIDAAKRMAATWGATFHDVGNLGHINANSGIGFWPYGRELLSRMCALGKQPMAENRAHHMTDFRPAVGLGGAAASRGKHVFPAPSRH